MQSILEQYKGKGCKVSLPVEVERGVVNEMESVERKDGLVVKALD